HPSLSLSLNYLSLSLPLSLFLSTISPSPSPSLSLTPSTALLCDHNQPGNHLLKKSKKYCMILLTVLRQKTQTVRCDTIFHKIDLVCISQSNLTSCFAFGSKEPNW